MLEESLYYFNRAAEVSRPLLRPFTGKELGLMFASCWPAGSSARLGHL